MIPIPSTRLIAAGIVVLALTASHWKAYVSGENHIRDQNAVAMARAIDRANAGTIALQVESEKRQNAKIASLQKLNTDANRVIGQLRLRNSRPSDLSNTPTSATASCTGAGLYREDGIFLIGEAARAKEVVIQWQQCQDQYNEVRDKFNTKAK